MARDICGWVVLSGLLLCLIGCSEAEMVPQVAPTVPTGIATSLPSATATLTHSLPITATEPPTSAPTAYDNRFTVYGFRTKSPIAFNTFSALEFPAGREISTLALDQATQGAFFALSPRAGKAYVRAGTSSNWELIELTLPTMQVVKRILLGDGIDALGTYHGLAISTDGREVYAETARIIGPNRWDPRLQVGLPDTAYAIAVYDVAQGAFVRSIPLEPPWCGVASLFALPDGQLLVRCPTAREVRWLDTRLGRQLASLSVGGVGGVLSPDRRVLWMVSGNGHLFEIDMTKRAITWTSDLSDGLAPIVPWQEPHVSADGKRLFVRAAPGPEELWRQGLATVIWIVETTTFQHIADVSLPTPAYDFIPSPDGRLLVISTLNWEQPSERGTYVMDTDTGRELGRWPWMLSGMQTKSSN